MSSARFRAGVGVLVVGDDGRVLAFERSDLGSWQAPQGGIDEGEAPIDAARRELAEETALSWPGDVELVADHPAWLGYEFPAEADVSWNRLGQVHKWFLVRLVGDPSAIDLREGTSHQEFSRWQWMTVAELIDQTWPPRRPIYRILAAEWASHLAG
ncbi:MAG: RNA pyrophosphohydrolase [Actinomycetota bacterium]|nr:RNA pyrophosphohydrolase [Actinomycetota bacterium]